MKKVMLVLGAFAFAGALLVVSCKKDAKPGFTATPASAKIGDAISFMDGGGDRKNATYTWDFGDGSGMSTERNPSHTYMKAGTYHVYQTVTVNKNFQKGKGFTQSATSDVTVTGPTASFTASKSTVNVSEPVIFTNTSTDAMWYNWTWVNSNGTTGETGWTKTKEYATMFAEPGTFTFVLYADASYAAYTNSTVASAATVITVNGTPPSTQNDNNFMLAGKWSFTGDNIVVTGNVGGTGCPAYGPDGTYPANPVHTSLTFNIDGSCWLVDATGNQTTGFGGSWAFNSNASLLTFTGGPGQLLAPIGGTYSVSGFTASTLTLKVKEVCPASPGAMRERTLSLTKP